MSIDFVLLVISAVSFGLATANVPSRINLVSLGLFTWVLTFLV